MKSRSLLPFASSRNFLLLSAISLALHGASSAATFTWTNGDITGLWSSTSTTTDWKSATVPNAAGSKVQYNLSPTAAAAGTVTLDMAATIGIITQLNNPSGGNNGVFKIEKSGTNALTFDNTGGVTNVWGTAAASIEFAGNGNTNDQLQVNPDIIITNTDLNIATTAGGVKIGASANNSAITATTSQSLILRGNAATRALTINHSIGTAGAGTITLNSIGSSGVVTTLAGNLGAQVGSLNQNGGNPLLLSGTNSDFAGPTTITTGILRYSAATALPAVGSGRSITVNTGGVVSAGYAIDNTFLGRIVQSSTGAIALNVASGNALDFTGFTDASLAATAAVTYSGALTPNAQAYRFGGSTAKLTVSSALNDSGGASSVTKVGSDTVALSGTNGYTNGTTVSAGTLQFTKAAALSNYNVSSKVSVANGATLAVNYGGGADWTSGEINDLLSFNGAGFAAGSVLAFDTTNLSGSYASNISVANLSLTKLGTNTLTLDGTNSYTGVTTITAGTVSVATIGNGGVAGNLGQAAAAASNIVFNGGTLKYTGANSTSDRAFTINAGITATIDTTNNLSLAGATGAASTGNLTKAGSGVLTLTGVNTYGGTTTVSAGTLRIASGGSFTTTNATNTNSLLVGGTAGNSLLHIQNGGTGTATRLQIGTVNGGNGAIHNQGTLTVNGTANLGNFALGFATGAYGYYRHDTGTTTTVNEIGIGTTSSSTTANLGGNGVVDVLQGKVANAAWFSMNRGDATQYSQLNISGGTFELANNATQVGLFMNNNDTQNNKGGHAVINLSGTGSLTSAGTATELDLMRISQPTTATTMLGVLNIGTGGTVQTNRIKATQANGTALLNFHGGTLKANNTAVTLLGGVGSNIDGAYVYSGGANLDTNGKTVTVAQALLAPTGGGVSSIPVTANGTGYIGRPVVYLTGGDGSGATAVADFNPTTGEVTGVTITNPGTGYTTAPTVTISGGGGTAPTLGTVTLAANTSGGLTKSGTGTLNLTAANSYTGDTTVSEGTLSLGDATNNTSLENTAKVFVASGATLNLNYLVGNTDTVKELWIGGVQKAAGVYSSSDPSGQITGSGTLTVTNGPGGYGSWQSANSATGQTVDQDHDNDGVDNGIEYFLGGNTVTTGFTALPAPVAGAVTWTKAATYTGALGTDFKIQRSTDLTTWTDAATSGSSGVPGTVFVSGSDYIYTLPTGAGKTFVRLLVNPN